MTNLADDHEAVTLQRSRPARRGYDQEYAGGHGDSSHRTLLRCHKVERPSGVRIWCVLGASRGFGVWQGHIQALGMVASEYAESPRPVGRVPESFARSSASPTICFACASFAPSFATLESARR
jgi:hypothetical protein